MKAVSIAVFPACTAGELSEHVMKVGVFKCRIVVSGYWNRDVLVRAKLCFGKLFHMV